jgi:glycosyltransferase involved in cell wall biosynthesis
MRPLREDDPTMIAAEDAQIEISDRARLPVAPLVSVIIMAYNHGQYLTAALESVLAQTADFPFEVLVGEDCSPDNTREVALRYQEHHPDRVRVITAERNVGVMRNYRRLLAASRGEFIAYLDGDDAWLPGKLQLQVDFLRNHPDSSAVYANAVTIDEKGARVGQFNDIGTARFDLPALLRHGNFLNASSMLIRAEVRKDVLAIEEPFIDYRVHLRAARSGLLAHFGETLAVYRINSSSSMLSQSNDQVRECYWEAILDVPRDRISKRDFARGLADFMRRIIFRSVRVMRWSLLREWAPKVYSASPYGIVRTSVYVASAVVRSACIKSSGFIAELVGGQRILYRR